jgi:hypothetical protein
MPLEIWVEVAKSGPFFLLMVYLIWRVDHHLCQVEIALRELTYLLGRLIGKDRE